MPCSDPAWIEIAARKILREQPKSVLDVGVGFGMGGMVAREYGDAMFGRPAREQWTVRLDGIEVFPPYIMPHQKAIYSNIYLGDALAALPQLGTYDLALCIDVLEHFEREKGLELLRLIDEHAAHFLISTPEVFFPQDAACGNEAEKHRDVWTPAELAGWGTVTACETGMNNGRLLMVEK